MKRLLLFLTALFSLTSAPAQRFSKQQYREDFDYFWQTIRDNYSYWDKKATDWNRVKERCVVPLDTITTTRSFVGLLEQAFYELYDHHASLNTNNPESQRLVPSGADIWAGYEGGKPFVTEVRRDYGAWKTGIKPGMEIVAFNDTPVEKALESLLPGSLQKDDIEARNFALRTLLAGQHSQKRKITVSYRGARKDFFPDTSGIIDDYRYHGSIQSSVIISGIGYIRINNSLGDNDLIAQFDSVLNTLMSTRSLILDLRETPGGGNTTVARAILGRFITKEGFFQMHEIPAEERTYGVKRSWQEIVSPRPNPYTRPLVVLVNHWTGSVGEGMAIGLDALKRATVIGTRMAGLNGANYSFRLPHTGIGFSFPAEKLFHVRGTPREAFVPPVEVKPAPSDRDEILDLALAYLRKAK